MLDLSNEELNIHFGFGAAKISEVKFGSRKKICQVSWASGATLSNLAKLMIFFQPETVIFLQPRDLQKCTVPDLKKSI